MKILRDTRCNPLMCPQISNKVIFFFLTKGVVKTGEGGDFCVQSEHAWIQEPEQSEWNRILWTILPIWMNGDDTKYMLCSKGQ